MMKRMISIIIIVLSILAAFTGCQSKSKVKSEEEADSGAKINVVTTIFPPYDFTRQIAGDKADITMLLAPGSESEERTTPFLLNR